uniref:Uncharacterized protein n=1 Tax=Oryza barthii TaxID=65489 RepID=A0A0D3EUD6_9ORYZ
MPCNIILHQIECLMCHVTSSCMAASHACILHKQFCSMCVEVTIHLWKPGLQAFSNMLFFTAQFTHVIYISKILEGDIVHKEIINDLAIEVTDSS